MSGIAGIWNRDGQPVREHELGQFAESLMHRGTADCVSRVDAQASFGFACCPHAARGSHPKWVTVLGNDRYWISYDGSIYNSEEVRRELQRLGHDFTSMSESELVLAAYAKWGKRSQLRFNGMWAFALWDRRQRTLFLSRDRYGAKPLYYHHQHRRFAFASEMKAFLRLTRFSLEFDNRALASMIANRSRVHGTPRTFLTGVKRLPSGHCLTLQKALAPQIERWWNTLAHLSDPAPDFDEQVKRFRDLLYDSCQLRISDDAATGVPLSGGMDSGSVLMSASQLRGERGQTPDIDIEAAFVITYPGRFRDEKEYAGLLAHRAGVPTVEIPFRVEDVVSHVDRLIFQIEDVTAIPLSSWLLYNAMGKEQVALSMEGYGSDELLAGYRHHVRHALIDALEQPLRPLRLVELVLIYRFMIPEALRSSPLKGWRVTTRMFKSAAEDARKRPARQSGIVPPRFLRGWRHLRTTPRPFSYPSFEADKTLLNSFKELEACLYYDFHYSKLPGVLSVSDLCSAPHNVETRKPFMDWRLVTYAFSLPGRNKLGKGFSKRILREAMRGIMPEVVRTRRSKVCFINDTEDYFGGLMKPLVYETINSETFLQSKVWNGPGIRELVERSYATGEHRVLFWRCIQATRLMNLFRAEYERFH